MSTDSPRSPGWPKRPVIVMLALLGGTLGLFFALMLLLDSSDDPDGGSNGEPPAAVDADSDDAVNDTDGAPDRTSTTLPGGVPTEMVGQWTQTQRVDVATRAAVDVVIGEALRPDITADGAFTQQLGDADVTEQQILRAIQDGDDLQVLVYADEAKLAEGEHRLVADVEIEGSTMAWTFGEESTLVFERDRIDRLGRDRENGRCKCVKPGTVVSASIDCGDAASMPTQSHGQEQRQRSR
jgi:hypothetical protein